MSHVLGPKTLVPSPKSQVPSPKSQDQKPGLAIQNGRASLKDETLDFFGFGFLQQNIKTDIKRGPMCPALGPKTQVLSPKPQVPNPKIKKRGSPFKMCELP